MSASTAPHALQRLGLLPDAEARDIRRAYARELKKIDQARDAAGFQALRGAYEEALQFAQWQRDHHTPDAAGAPAGGPAEPVEAVLFAQSAPATPDQLADAVAEEFCTTLTALGAAHRGATDARYEDMLRHALADERLFGIAARQGFELRMAMILAHGWRPGHEALLVAAAAVFDWSRGQQLAVLGQAGAIIDRALEERAIFDTQAMADKQAQRRLLALLRQEAVPEHAQMMQDIPVFMRMQARFPHWLSIVAPHARILYWQEYCNAVPHEHHAAPMAPMSVAPEKSPWPMRLLICLLCCLGLVLYTEGTRSPAPPPVDDTHLSKVQGEPIMQERFNDIIARADVRMTPEEARHAFAIEFDVFLDPEGRVVGATPIAASGNARVDAAVRAAIMASAPFPSETKRTFALTFTYTPPAGTGKKHP